IKRKRCQLVAPSRVAASYREGDTVCRPASKVIATNGTPRQILAKITLPRARLASPRKLMLWSIRPILISDHEMIENCESKIHQNAIADRTDGTMNGTSTMERMFALNGICRFNSSAR